MSHNIRAGRLRHHGELYSEDGSTDEWGDMLPPQLDFDIRCEVQEKSGKEMSTYGTTVTSRVITVLTWFDERIKNDMLFKWNGTMFRIQHVQPDTMGRSMVFTCEVEQ